MPDTVLGTGDTVLKEIDVVSPLRRLIGVGRRQKDNKQLQFRVISAQWGGTGCCESA